MPKKPKDIKHQIENTLHTVADVAQQQYQKNIKKDIKRHQKNIGKGYATTLKKHHKKA